MLLSFSEGGSVQEILVYVDSRLEKLIPKFITAQWAQIALIKVAFKKLDYSNLKLLGHKMKGACGGYGFSMLGELGEKIEKYAQTQDKKHLKETINQLENCLSHVKIAYRKV